MVQFLVGACFIRNLQRFEGRFQINAKDGLLIGVITVFGILW